MTEDLRERIGRAEAFAAFRMPFDNEFTVVMQRGIGAFVSDSVAELAGRRGFVMVPFSLGRKWPVVMVRPDDVVRTHVPDAWGESMLSSGLCSDSGRKVYEQAFEAFHGAVSCGEFDKLVLSRCSERHLEGGNLLDSFIKACHMYPRMMVYLCRTAEGGVWFGCTPEILLSGRRSHYSTVALAGTMSVPESDTRTVEWSTKNVEEQRIVADYIRQKLHGYADVIEEEGPYTSRAGHLIHLKTVFHFTPAKTGFIPSLVEELYPTPAVCGLPKEKAKRFIEENEGYDRGYYAGIVGMLDETGDTELYVNLRCARIDGHVAHLYAGGGILPTSELEQEWTETEEKLKTIGNVFR